jgi:drug/metabolite transporter (DMT)-like permease
LTSAPPAVWGDSPLEHDFRVRPQPVEQVGPLTGGAAVYLIGGSLCVVRLAWWRARTRRILGLPRLYLVGCGSLFVYYTAAVYLALGLARSREQLLEIALLNYLWPCLTVVVSLMLLNKRARLWLVPGTALALAGIFLVMTQDGDAASASFQQNVRSNPMAYALALAAAFAWALYSNLTRRWAASGSNGAVELFIPATGLVLLAVRLLTHEPGCWSIRAAAEASGLAVVTTLALSSRTCPCAKATSCWWWPVPT